MSLEDEARELVDKTNEMVHSQLAYQDLKFYLLTFVNLYIGCLVLFSREYDILKLTFIDHLPGGVILYGVGHLVAGALLIASRWFKLRYQRLAYAINAGWYAYITAITVTAGFVYGWWSTSALPFQLLVCYLSMRTGIDLQKPFRGTHKQ